MFENMSLTEIIKIGGPVMYVLIACSVISVAAIVERLLYYYSRSGVTRIVFMEFIREQILKGNVSKAKTLCEDASMPFAAVVFAGLKADPADQKEVSEAMEREIVIEIQDLERRTAILGTIGSTAIYIGLLGTVWGIVRTFSDIAQIGSNGMPVVIKGISEALVCTAAGLVVTIPAVVAYNYFIKRISRFVTDMELCASETAGLVKRLPHHEKTL